MRELRFLVFGLPHLLPPSCFFGLPGCCEDAGQYWELTLEALEPPVENGVPPVVPAIAATPASSRAAASAGLARRDLAILPRLRGVETGPAARFIASSFMRSSSRGVASAPLLPQARCDVVQVVGKPVVFAWCHQRLIRTTGRIPDWAG